MSHSLSQHDSDLRFMRMALGLARRGLGNVWPNPAVGCVIVKNGVVIGRGWTARGGRPHAETLALSQAGDKAKGASMYVTLEPCSHHGKTPPCIEAILASGIARVVVATQDLNPVVQGKGIAALMASGIEVLVGICEEEAWCINQGFFKVVTRGLPMVTLKCATSLDGKIATQTGDSQWITGDEARAYGHFLRASHDAIMVGRGTVEADDPGLTCRLPGREQDSPIRVVCDSKSGLRASHQVFQTAHVIPTWVLAVEGEQEAAEVDTLLLPSNGEGKVDLVEALKILAEQGITRVLIEGGGQLAASMLLAGLVDEVIWFRAPKIIGGEGIPAIAAQHVEKLSEAKHFKRLSVAKCGEDVVEHYRATLKTS